MIAAGQPACNISHFNLTTAHTLKDLQPSTQPYLELRIEPITTHSVKQGRISHIKVH